MKKRLLALLLAIVIVVGLVVVAIPASAAQSETNTYKVGYAKLDVNPWILYEEEDLPTGVSNMTYTDESGKEIAIGVPYNAAWAESNYADRVQTTTADGKTVGMISTRLAGSGTSSNNYACGVLDDNADGKVGYGDGLQVTATTVTDANGKTAVFITIDSIGGYQTVMLDYLVKYQLNDLNAKIDGTIDGNAIYINGSHSHNAPDLGNLSAAYTNSSNAAYKGVNNPVGAYLSYYRSRVVDAVVAAYKNATPATMSKGQIDASDASGLQLNFVRQYTTSEVENGVTLVGGSNFGCHSKKVDEVYEADDTMYLLQFTPTNGGKPTVLVNWRAHGTFIGGSTAANYSSDYIGSLRRYLAETGDGYNVAFLQGAAGNAVPENIVDPGNDPWKQETVSGFNSGSVDTSNLQTDAEDDVEDAAHYGYLLSKVAKKCLDENMSDPLQAGDIRYQTSDFDYTVQEDTPEQKAAAIFWNTQVENWLALDENDGKSRGDASKALGFTGSGGFGTTHTVTIDDDTSDYNNTSVIFNSYYHLDSVYSRTKLTAETGTISVGAIMLGDQVAMVTCGNELFDRYNAEDTIGNIVKNDNDWLELQDNSAGSYGTPFVLAYTNGNHAYMPNTLAYTYNDGSSSYAAGCYEANTSKFAAGTGEALVAQFDNMLTALNNVGLGDDYYASLPEAVAAAEAAEGDSLIKLFGNITIEEDLHINKNLYLDLNGKSITFNNDAKIVIDAEKTLYCMDSETADFTVNENNDNNNFGKISSNRVEGNIVGVPEGTNLIADGLQYVMIDDGENYSFHCVKLDTYAITVQAYEGDSKNPSVYYTSDFAGDEVIAEKVTEYGVALSILGEPTAENFETQCLATALTTQKKFEAGADANTGTGTLLYNILNTNNAELVNRRNANTKVYGKAYVITDEGYLFGNLADYSLKDVFELANDNWSSYRNDPEAVASVTEMIKTYNTIMKNWNIKDIRVSAAPSDDNELNVLMIGNSFCYYYVEELYGMLAEQYPDKTVRVCNVYQSGRTLQQHWTHWKQGDAGNDYFFYITDSNGRKEAKREASLVECLEWEGWEWDVVSLQEASSKYISYSATTHYANSKTYLNDLWDLITEKAPFARQLWHATWSYQVGHSQTADAAAQATAADRSRAFGVWVCEDYGLEAVNTVTAWQNVRNDYSYDNLCYYKTKSPTTDTNLDYYHDGDTGGGQYLNACVWYEVITGEDCTQISYTPSNYELDANITYTQLRQAAHKAVNP